jgi:hypothetical protein
MQRFLNFFIFIFTDALHVSGGSSAHHQLAAVLVLQYLKLYVQFVLLMMGGGTA